MGDAVVQFTGDAGSFRGDGPRGVLLPGALGPVGALGRLERPARPVAHRLAHDPAAAVEHGHRDEVADLAAGDREGDAERDDGQGEPHPGARRVELRPGGEGDDDQGREDGELAVGVDHHHPGHDEGQHRQREPPPPGHRPHHHDGQQGVQPGRPVQRRRRRLHQAQCDERTGHQRIDDGRPPGQSPDHGHGT
nr:hypothetical protein [Blastococcus saxobsidens]